MTYYEGRFTDYTVVVTGAANGIGRSCAERFAQEGAHTVICDIDRQNLKTTEDEIVKKGQKVQSFVFDIGKKNEVDKAMKETLDTYKKIEVLVHCAGIANEKRFIDLTEEDWLRTININLNGSFYILQPIVRNMVENRFGKIINITSKSGLIGRANRTPYSASKFGQNGLTQALALEVAPYNVNVNAICPSRIESQMTIGIFKDRAKLTNKSYEVIRDEYIKSVPIGRLGLPEDIAAMAAFLATEEASYITGQFISVSGGR
jgi:NAD(P)-dependent dehydrogenase (short-subunit alcohol dehydrogenase family)